MLSRGKPITLGEFREDLESIIPAGDKVIVVHSGLWGFASRLDVPVHDVPDTVIRVLEEVIGPDRTLVMPTYTFDFPRTREFDLKRSKPATGLIVEAFLAYPGVRRSHKPMNSYAVMGPESETLLNLPCTTAWGADSVMGWFNDIEVRFVTLGIHSLLSCSYFHMAEELERVPYRYFKRFFGKLYDDGHEVGPCEEVMYVRPLGVEHEFIGKLADTRLEDRGLKMRPEREDGIFMESMNMRDIIGVSCEAVKEDAYVMVAEKDRDAVKTWVKDGNLDAEIAAVPPAQRFDPDT